MKEGTSATYGPTGLHQGQLRGMAVPADALRYLTCADLARSRRQYLLQTDNHDREARSKRARNVCPPALRACIQWTRQLKGSVAGASLTLAG